MAVARGNALRRVLRRARKLAAERLEHRAEMAARLARQRRRVPGFTPYPRAGKGDRGPVVTLAALRGCAWPAMAPLTRREREEARDAARKAQSQRR